MISDLNNLNKKFKILHLVPNPYGGGVETAAKSFLNYDCSEFIFEVFFLKNKKNQNTFKTYLSSLLKIKAINPDIILTSLWKSNLVTLIFKAIKSDTKCILFLHSTNNKHFLDGIVTTLTALIAYEIWADSKETLIKRIDSLYINKFFRKHLLNKSEKRIISFLLKKEKPLKNKKCKPFFIYWGRLCPNKKIDKSLEIFAEIYKINQKSTFTIIGPDFGAKKKIYKIVKKLGIQNNVFIYDFLPFNEIKKYAQKACFFIQLSSYEGMAMSVIESMQLGLIPLVTDVGQIKYYCKDLHNSLIYKYNNFEFIGNIFEIISSEKSYNSIRENVIKQWINYPTYKQDLIKEFRRLIKIN